MAAQKKGPDSSAPRTTPRLRRSSSADDAVSPRRSGPRGAGPGNRRPATGAAAAASSARKALLALVAVTALLAATLIWGVGTDRTGWAPKLALDLEGGTQMVLSPSLQGEKAGQDITQEQLDQAVEIIRQRVDGAGVSEAEITTQSGSNIVVSMPGVPSSETRDLIQTSAQMAFRPVIVTGPGEATPKDQRTKAKDIPKSDGKPSDSSDPRWITPQLFQSYQALDCTAPQPQKDRAAQPQDKAVVACDPESKTKFILGPVEIPGTEIADASYAQATNSQGHATGGYAVNLQFDEQGTATFKELSERLYGLGQKGQQDPRSQFAIVLDGSVVSAPSMNSVITDGKAQITGNFTEDEAKFLSQQLKYGALPVSFSIDSEQQISATLGSNQLRMGIVAGLIGLALVCVYSLFQYRWLGLVTIASLVVAGVLTYLAITLLGWGANYRLSLAGVAGLVVAIGQTADSFIVYFERIRDEIRAGRTIPAAVDHGWQRARQTVLASKAVNLLAAVVLYFVAVGNVRGFAFTLGLTAIADLLVVFLFTHPVMVLLARTRYFGSGAKNSGLDPEALDAVPMYRGAGRLRSPEDSDGLTIAERRRRTTRAAQDADGAGDTTAPTVDGEDRAAPAPAASSAQTGTAPTPGAGSSAARTDSEEAQR
ncbi:protein translocase subunit SecD [Kocuria rhizophila]|uniref:protein translocase subunit SecD n=1 Tax=Kocuria rhizophila TaxID=72000 RepID=UPI001D5217CD|nr:protein translocase subunit SecD [Kocuria rhizophila]MCC5671758.1 protein translocase subunit SecD [Kocuria rhizophila]